MVWPPCSQTALGWLPEHPLYLMMRASHTRPAHDEATHLQHQHDGGAWMQPQGDDGLQGTLEDPLKHSALSSLRRKGGGRGWDVRCWWRNYDNAGDKGSSSGWDSTSWWDKDCSSWWHTAVSVAACAASHTSLHVSWTQGQQQWMGQHQLVA